MATIGPNLDQIGENHLFCPRDPKKATSLHVLKLRYKSFREFEILYVDGQKQSILQPNLDQIDLSCPREPNKASFSTSLIMFYKERSVLATPWQISYFLGHSLAVP